MADKKTHNTKDARAQGETEQRLYAGRELPAGPAPSQRSNGIA